MVTSPVAFLLAGVLDWVVLFGRYAYVRARGRSADWFDQ